MLFPPYEIATHIDPRGARDVMPEPQPDRYLQDRMDRWWAARNAATPKRPRPDHLRIVPRTDEGEEPVQSPPKEPVRQPVREPLEPAAAAPRSGTRKAPVWQRRLERMGATVHAPRSIRVDGEPGR